MDNFNIEYDFELKAQNEDDKFFYFEGYGSTKDRDLVDDIVEPTAFDESLAEKMPKMLWQHDTHQPIGIYEDAKPNKSGLFVKGKMPKDDDFVRGRVIPQMKIGSINSLSIGFRTKEFEYNRDKNIRIVKKADLMEISLVTFPANPKARVTALKAWAEGRDESAAVNNRDNLPKSFADRSHRWDAASAEKRIHDAALEKRAYLWVDDDEHKLQVADIVDGEVTLIPRAIFAARAMLSGAKGGAAIADDDNMKIRPVVNALYKEMELEEPFKADGSYAPFCKSEIKCLTKGMLSDIIRNEKLSKDAADYVADVILADAYGNDSNDLAAVDDFLSTLKSSIK